METTPQNEELKPGRELDAIIAEKVTNWTDIEWVKPAHMGYKVAQGIKPDERPSSFTGYRPKYTVPNYSEDISAAWKIVERLDLFSRYYLTRTPEGTFAGQNGNYKIMTYESDDMGSMGEMSFFTYAEAPTVQMVICLAALKAISK